MNLKQLRYFLAVSDAQSFSGAASNVLISQSALSRQIGLLENELGARLFDRYGRGVQLTEAGILLHTRVHSVLSQIENIKQEVSEEANEPSGEIGFAFPPSLTNLLGMRTVRKFRTDCPRVYLRLIEGTTSHVREKLVAGDADVGIISSVELSSDLYCSPLFTEQMMLVGPVSSDLSLDEPVALDVLRGWPHITTPHPNSLRKIIEKALHKKGLKLNHVIEANTRGLMFELIDQGLGYTVLPSSGIVSQMAKGTIKAAPINGQHITWQIATARSRALTRAARRLVTIIREEAVIALQSETLPTARLDI